MKKDFRSACPVSYALDLMGDKWSLLIVRDMIFFRKKTFKEFTESNEGIATNILSSRLKFLEELNIITKEQSPTNKKVNHYLLTENGIALTPMITELLIWGHNHSKDINPKKSNFNFNNVKNSKDEYIEKTKKKYRDFALLTNS